MDRMELQRELGGGGGGGGGDLTSESEALVNLRLQMGLEQGRGNDFERKRIPFLGGCGRMFSSITQQFKETTFTLENYISVGMFYTISISGRLCYIFSN